MAQIEKGLKAHWPSRAGRPSIAEVLLWATADLPHATLGRATAKTFIERGLKKHWRV